MMHTLPRELTLFFTIWLVVADVYPDALMRVCTRQVVFAGAQLVVHV